MKKYAKALTYGTFNSKSGRNNQGCITVRRRGGGHKKLYRYINFKQNFNKAKLLSIEYDPFRTAKIGRFLDLDTLEIFYSILAEDFDIENFLFVKSGPFKIGNRFMISKIPLGFLIHNVELRKGKGGQVCRAAGSFCKLLQKDFKKGYARIKLPSKEERFVPLSCFATIGIVSNSFLKNKKLKKAGNSRWVGKRPSVRGVAMNPVDHPHGGGEGKTSGGRPSVTPWGRITKGQPTRSNKNNRLIIIKRRQF